MEKSSKVTKLAVKDTIEFGGLVTINVENKSYDKCNIIINETEIKIMNKDLDNNDFTIDYQSIVHFGIIKSKSTILIVYPLTCLNGIYDKEKYTDEEIDVCINIYPEFKSKLKTYYDCLVHFNSLIKAVDEFQDEDMLDNELYTADDFDDQS